MPTNLPVYSIYRIRDKDSAQDECLVARFADYLQQRNFLLKPHGHSFFHLVYFTKGSGKQFIDFTQYPIKPGMIYFMQPGQVHHWKFASEPDGFIINFSINFFQSFLADPHSLERFPFFEHSLEDQVIALPPASQEIVQSLFEQILGEIESSAKYSSDMVRSLLLQLFIHVSRKIEPGRQKRMSKPGYTVYKNFQRLINEHFATMKLPAEYAALLYVTPNYLNSLCKDLLNKTAGEIIRDRIMLEAKRLLTNADMTIGEIAHQLNFPDNSYFSKFFKKYAGKTPEEFRKEQQ